MSCLQHLLKTVSLTALSTITGTKNKSLFPSEALQLILGDLREPYYYAEKAHQLLVNRPVNVH